MFKLPEGVIYIVKTLKDNGYKAFVVGGGVRDLILGDPVYDWDITTDAPPQNVTGLFEKVVPTGIKYGTVTVMLYEGEFEVTTFRCDEKYSDGRRPDKVVFTQKIEDDLSRRDSTVNAIAYDPLNGNIIDPFQGRSDIRGKVIKAVGDPLERFNEDGLRSLRACRFAAKLNFSIEDKTLDAMAKTIPVFRKVSVERVHDEIMKMMLSDKPSTGFEYMRKTGLLKEIFPELLACLGVEQPKPFHVHDVYYHSIYACDHAPKELPIVRIAALLHDVSKPSCKKEMTFYNHDNEGAETARKILNRLKFSNADTELAVLLIKNHMFNYNTEWSDSAVRRFMKRVGVANLEDLFLLRTADMKAMDKEPDPTYIKELRTRIDNVLRDDNAISISQLKLNGEDIMKVLQVPQGRKVGQILEALLEKVIDDPSLNDRSKLLSIARMMKDHV